jgi:hypothetical protein
MRALQCGRGTMHSAARPRQASSHGVHVVAAMHGGYRRRPSRQSSPGTERIARASRTRAGALIADGQACRPCQPGCGALANEGKLLWSVYSRCSWPALYILEKKADPERGVYVGRSFICFLMASHDYVRRPGGGWRRGAGTRRHLHSYLHVASLPPLLDARYALQCTTSSGLTRMDAGRCSVVYRRPRPQLTTTAPPSNPWACTHARKLQNTRTGQLRRRPGRLRAARARRLRARAAAQARRGAPQTVAPNQP